MGESNVELRGVLSKGYGLIPKMVMLDRNICAGAKAMYAYFCSYSGNGSSVFPSFDKISYDLCISRDTIRKYVSELEQQGYITVVKNKDKGKFANNTYIINLDVLSNEKNLVEKIESEKSSRENRVEEVDCNNNNINNNNSINKNIIKNNNNTGDVANKMLEDIYNKPLSTRLTEDEYNKLKDKYIDVEGLLSEVNKKTKGKKIEHPYEYIKKYAYNNIFETWEERKWYEEAMNGD